jgi:FAD/FMN-containing dehydrogenase
MASLSILARDLAQIVGERHVREARGERLTYSMDGLPTHRRVPDLVVLPGSREELIAVVRLLAALEVPFVPRGAGTGLSGGALASEGSVLLVLTRLNRVLQIDKANRRAVVEPGVVNAKLGAAAKPHGLQYAPDPSSQSACTIGGNVAENAGGPHCLKYGVTANHILALEILLADGSLVEIGSPGGEPWGPDLVGLFVGSEGNFGIATRITARLTPLPRAIRTLLPLHPHPHRGRGGLGHYRRQAVRRRSVLDQSRAVRFGIPASYPRDAAAVSEGPKSTAQYRRRGRGDGRGHRAAA